MEAQALKTGEGRSYSWVDYLFTVKACVSETAGCVAIMEFFSRKGDEPGVHVHEDEDEIFYVLEGNLTVTCGNESFELAPNSFIFLPRNLPHGFTVHDDGLVHMLVVTVSAESVENFGERIEREGEPLTAEAAARRIEELRGSSWLLPDDSAEADDAQGPRIVSTAGYPPEAGEAPSPYH